MGGGDLKNSLERLRQALKSVRYPHLHSIAGEPSVADLLRVLHYVLLDYSRYVAAFILEKGYDLYGKTDARFMDHTFRLLREEFQYFPSLNTSHFLSTHYLERKIDLVTDIVDVVVKKHAEGLRVKRQQHAVWTKPPEIKKAGSHVENHLMPVPAVFEQLHVDSRRKQEELRRALKRSTTTPQETATSSTRQTQERSVTWQLNSPERVNVQEQFDFYQAERRESSVHRRQQDNQTHDDVPPRSLTHNEPSSCSCGCVDSKEEVQEVLVTLSQQISDLTSAVLSRLSVIETRLDRVEQQVEDLAAPALATYSTWNTRPTPSTSTYSAYPPPKHSFPHKETHQPASTESPRAAAPRFQMSWPPDPELFDRH
ncbi:hypothetical protein Poli38472_008404 [Pythium oligandrum]|uniref:Centrosomal protein of 44 kDa n=1 Tax=Pythium oligandrum TaxID=41045 RepID=A0A8K1FND8_PYTOL|nr:hypothetical protein Poli38472_008404 [Pythium oligandrum]|eukprot:TMW65762.1 hypothetical protein Poli38472_008404 [Pythium oligandrum]